MGLLRGLLRVSLAMAIAWAGAALFYTLPGPQLAKAAIAGGVAALGLGALAFARFGRALGISVVLLAAVALWWMQLRPSNDENWARENARTPHGEVDGDRLVLHDVRNFDYRTETDFTEHWETRSYDLSKLRGLDLFLSHWGSPSIAHTIMSWDFEGEKPLAISIETRKDKGQQYSAIAGFFRNYPILYVPADERDLVRLRTNYRGEHVWLYRLRMPVPRARALLLDYVDSMNRLVERPEWYNALTENCTTAIRSHVKEVGGSVPLDWRLFANGHLDELLYERGSVNDGVPFEELKERSQIDERAKAADQDPDFSVRIREGLPPR
jgi:hypothetical protein